MKRKLVIPVIKDDVLYRGIALELKRDLGVGQRNLPAIVKGRLVVFRNKANAIPRRFVQRYETYVRAN